MFTGEARVLVSLERLFAAVTQGAASGRRDEVTGLEYHASEAPPADAATSCMHLVSDPQASCASCDRWRPPDLCAAGVLVLA